MKAKAGCGWLPEVVDWTHVETLATPRRHGSPRQLVATPSPAVAHLLSQEKGSSMSLFDGRKALHLGAKPFELFGDGSAGVSCVSYTHSSAQHDQVDSC